MGHPLILLLCWANIYQFKRWQQCILYARVLGVPRMRWQHCEHISLGSTVHIVQCTCNAFFTPDLLCINYCPLSTHDTSSVGVNQRPFRVFFLPEIHPNLETQASLRCAWYLYDAHQCMLSLWWSVPYIQHTQVNVSTCFYGRYELR